MANPMTPASMIKIQAIYSVNVFADMSPYPTVATTGNVFALTNFKITVASGV